MEPGLKTLIQAESIIQRDALISALASHGINAFADKRDISRKIADSTIDLAYEGYSALFDGFTIHVNEADFERAKIIVEEVLKRARETVPEPAAQKGTSIQKFYFCCLFTVVLPGIFHGLALYHLAVGLRRGERLKPLFAVFSFAILVVTAATLYTIYRATDIFEFLRSLADKV